MYSPKQNTITNALHNTIQINSNQTKGDKNMENKIEIFKNDQFGEIRTVQKAAAKTS